MRIDEFSAASNINDTFSSKEQTRFLLFGFDVSLIAEWLNISSPVQITETVESTVTAELLIESPVTSEVLLSSPIGD